MKFIYKLIIFALLLCSFVGTVYSVQAQPAVSIDAKAAILIDSNTGTVLFEKNSTQRLPIASITKIMTLCLTFESIEKGELSLEDKIQISHKAASIGGSHVFTDENEYYKAGDLIKSVIIASANDACTALAEHIGGTEENFVAKMNTRATEMGMTNTHFANCTGMPAENAGSCAADVAIMSRELVKHQDFFRWSNIWMDELTHKGGRVTGLTNTNKLVRFFAGCDGIKTGYTDEAGHCVSASVEKGNMRLIAVILGGSSSAARFEDAKTLINYGFADYKTEVLAPSELPQIRVKNGVKKFIKTAVVRPAAVVRERGAEKFSEAVTMHEVNAPVCTGDVVGTAEYTAGDEKYTVEIVAAEDSEEATIGFIFRRLVNRW